jgi:hypothetical protein
MMGSGVRLPVPAPFKSLQGRCLSPLRPGLNPLAETSCPTGTQRAEAPTCYCQCTAMMMAAGGDSQAPVHFLLVPPFSLYPGRDGNLFFALSYIRENPPPYTLRCAFFVYGVCVMWFVPKFAYCQSRRYSIGTESAGGKSSQFQNNGYRGRSWNRSRASAHRRWRSIAT